MVGYIALIVCAFTLSMLLISAIAFAKANDVFTMTHIVMIANCYIIPLLLIGIEIENFSWVSLAKIIGLIVLNLVVVNLLCHAIIRRAILNKIDPKARIKRS